MTNLLKNCAAVVFIRPFKILTNTRMSVANNLALHSLNLICILKQLAYVKMRLYFACPLTLK
mgnify:CR=1 FL=1